MKVLKSQAHLGYVAGVTFVFLALTLVALTTRSGGDFGTVFTFAIVPLMFGFAVARALFALWMLTVHRAAETPHVGGRHVMHH